MSRQHSCPLLHAGVIIEQVKSVTLGDTDGLRLPASERPYRQLKSLLDPSRPHGNQHLEAADISQLVKMSTGGDIAHLPQE